MDFFFNPAHQQQFFCGISSLAGTDNRVRFGKSTETRLGGNKKFTIVAGHFVMRSALDAERVFESV